MRTRTDVDSWVQAHHRNIFVTDHYKYVTWRALSDRSANWPKPGLVTHWSVGVSSPAERGAFVINIGAADTSCLLSHLAHIQSAV